MSPTTQNNIVNYQTPKSLYRSIDLRNSYEVTVQFKFAVVNGGDKMCQVAA